MQAINQLNVTHTDEADFYRQLVTRNFHFVSPETQTKLKQLKVLVAGCGTAGGACIESLARLGVTRFRLADNGAYDLPNLNRQHAFVDSIGTNKAEFHFHETKRINPYADIEFYPEGISEANLPKLVEWADLIIDGVDVTTSDAIMLKIRLHEIAHEKKKAVFCMLDLGFCQWGESFDYREGMIKPLKGRHHRAKAAQHPIKVLFEMFPLSCVPAHALPLVHDVLVNINAGASQLGCASDLLSAIIAPSVLRFVQYGELVEGWNINLESYAHPFHIRARNWAKAPLLQYKIKKVLRKIR